MTDGETTSGSKDWDVLKNLVDPSIHNAFIGYGLYHDSELLQYISDYKNSSYHFIDAIEKSGLVYGEILHNILYKYLTNAEIVIQNGLVYNYKTNMWNDTLYIGDITGDSSKTFHLVSTIPDDCRVLLGFSFENEKICLNIPLVMCIEEMNLYKYIYRQRTLQLLFNSNEKQKRKIHRSEFSFDNFKEKQKEKQKDTEIKNLLMELFTEMNMLLENEENGMNHIDKNFIKNLCDDLYIAHSTYGTKFGTMYTTARQVSQGTQRCYTASSTPDDINMDSCNLDICNMDDDIPRFSLKLPVITRQTTRHITDLFEDPIIQSHFDSDITDSSPLQKYKYKYNVSNYTESPYCNDTASEVMKHISSHTDTE